MGEVLTEIIDWMDALAPIWAYAIILLIAYGENLVPPVPGDMVVVFGGVLAGRGQLDLAVVVVLSTVGGVAGFMTVYAFGRYVGNEVLESDRFTWIPTGQVEKARRWIHRWGYGVVAANRFLSGARAVIALTVGMAKMEPWKTASFATLSAVLWTTLISFAGYAVGDNWQIISVYLREYGRVVFGAVVLFAAIQATRYYLGRRRQAAARAEESDDV